MTKSKEETTVRTVDDVLRNMFVIHSGRTRYPGQEPRDDELLVAEIERLRAIEAAARNVAETLNGGFVVCQACGEQETTADLDYARELYAALGVKRHGT